jgi:hypothetical protein
MASGVLIQVSRLLDPKRGGKYPFKYESAATTDIRKTIKREQERLKAEKLKREEDQAEVKSKVRPIGKSQ